MPIYEYRCRACDASFELLLRSPSDDVACSSCGGTDVARQISRTAVSSTRTRQRARESGLRQGARFRAEKDHEDQKYLADHLHDDDHGDH